MVLVGVALVCVQVKRVAMLEELNYTCGVNESTLPGLEKLLSTDDDAYSACERAHAVAILTEWDAFKTLDWARIYGAMEKPAFVFDGRNILDHKALRAIGFEVYAIGKPVRGVDGPAVGPSVTAAAAVGGAGAASKP